MFLAPSVVIETIFEIPSCFFRNLVKHDDLLDNAIIKAETAYARQEMVSTKLSRVEGQRKVQTVPEHLVLSCLQFNTPSFGMSQATRVACVDSFRDVGVLGCNEGNHRLPKVCDVFDLVLRQCAHDVEVLCKDRDDFRLFFSLIVQILSRFGFVP